MEHGNSQGLAWQRECLRAGRGGAQGPGTWGPCPVLPHSHCSLWPHGGTPACPHSWAPAQVVWAPCRGGEPDRSYPRPRGQGGRGYMPHHQPCSQPGARAQGNLRQV